jgi:hypothetical protein
MQADGHIGGAFTVTSSILFRPIWFISQNASDGSITFFAQLHSVLSSLGLVNLCWTFSLTTAGNWHVRLYSRDMRSILTIIMIYFHSVYGEKYTAFIKLIQVNRLLALVSIDPRSLNSYILCVEIINLVYSFSSAANAVRKLTLADKLEAVIPVSVLETLQAFKLPTFHDNTFTIT